MQQTVEREQAAEHGTVAVPVAALVLACGSAVALGVAPRIVDAELLFSLAWLIGWMLVVWSAALGGGCAVRLLRCAWTREPVLRLEITITAAALVLVAAVVAVHPLAGSGSGSA
ncbi:MULTISPECIES: hypothetical protein [unclassified Rathayibacter]|uniref:hypothetical protein n=1 Tax=unclassified Rathayibacter TaxID=2609250 RepID=UPI0006FFC131|nr:MULTISPECIES: hypothetical protein [unclassified Rathayibacter]KQQ06021.1 hypothetical protein ASF42_05675 [Rathayibacter sp. Leaf294]KQS13878.1 hypothetical protein ASG06_05685 [Rathayibacter sp. Leaf185]